MSNQILPMIDESELESRTVEPFDAETLAGATQIVNSVRRGGEPALRELAARFGEAASSEPLLLGRRELDEARDRLGSDARGVLERSAERVREFSRAQRGTLTDLDLRIQGGRTGHTIEPVASAGCYAPGGRYPLPSSVLMTVIPARVAGVDRVIVASPRPTTEVLAAASIAGADMLLRLGGAHAIAALAHGVAIDDPVDFICGPGNRWVTAAKHVVSAQVGIDMLAGPSELMILADDSAAPEIVAADLIAQAEHDADARPWLVTSAPELVDEVNAELSAQLRSLPTASTARQSLARGWAVVVDGPDAMLRASDRLAPEHLQILTVNARELASRVRNAGAVFIGPASAEVLGDYAIGPNHTLPTGRSARFRGGLSVLDFLRLRTFIDLDHAPRETAADAAAMARMEGLEGHARAALAARL